MTGKEIRAALLLKNKNLTDIAKEEKVSKQLVSNVVNGHKRSSKVQFAVCRALGQPYHQVWGQPAT